MSRYEEILDSVERLEPRVLSHATLLRANISKGRSSIEDLQKALEYTSESSKNGSKEGIEIGYRKAREALEEVLRGVVEAGELDGKSKEYVKQMVDLAVQAAKEAPDNTSTDVSRRGLKAVAKLEAMSRALGATKGGERPKRGVGDLIRQLLEAEGEGEVEIHEPKEGEAGAMMAEFLEALKNGDAKIEGVKVVRHPR